MKKIILSIIVVASMSGCGNNKSVTASNLSDAATLLSSLSSNSTVQQISSLFSLLDLDKNNAISSTEAIGSIADNFKVLDKDSNSNLNLSELEGLLGLLK